MNLRLHKKADGDSLVLYSPVVYMGDLVWIPERRRRGVVKYEPKDELALIMVAGAEYYEQLPIQFGLNELIVLHSNNVIKDFKVGEPVKWNGKYLLGDSEDKALNIFQYDMKQVSNVKIDGGLKLIPANGACYTIEFIYKGVVNYSRPIWPENLESLEVKNYAFNIK